jgi:anti-anti-sigma factor
LASVRVERDSRGCVVIAEGDLDMTLAEPLEAAMEEAAEAAPDVVVDLSRATLLDSRAIGILLTWTERLRRIDGSLALAGASADVRRLFTTIGLDREFRFFRDRDEALGG